MNANDDELEEYEDRLVELRESRYRALGTRSPACSVESCEESDPFALTGAEPDVVCQEHLADKQHRFWAQDHHFSGQANSPEVGITPANDHAVVSAMQSLWPRETLRNPESSPLLRAAAAIRGWLDVLRLVIERTVGWIPAALELLNRLLCERLGPRWWDALGWQP